MARHGVEQVVGGYPRPRRRSRLEPDKWPATGKYITGPFFTSGTITLHIAEIADPRITEGRLVSTLWVSLTATWGLV